MPASIELAKQSIEILTLLFVIFTLSNRSFFYSKNQAGEVPPGKIPF